MSAAALLALLLSRYAIRAPEPVRAPLPIVRELGREPWRGRR